MNIMAINTVLICFHVDGQTVTYIDDTMSITYWAFRQDDAYKFDRVVSIKGFDQTYKDWRVYFDRKNEHLAYESNCTHDTCIMRDYWRNGRLKREVVYVEDSLSEVLYNNKWMWLNESNYYGTGQLESYDCPGKNECTATGYYPNGAKRWESVRIGSGPDLNKQVTIWDENGAIVTKEFWEKGELIKSD